MGGRGLHDFTSFNVLVSLNGVIDVKHRNKTRFGLRRLIVTCHRICARSVGRIGIKGCHNRGGTDVGRKCKKQQRRCRRSYTAPTHHRPEDPAIQVMRWPRQAASTVRETWLYFDSEIRFFQRPGGELRRLNLTISPANGNPRGAQMILFPLMTTWMWFQILAASLLPSSRRSRAENCDADIS